MTTDQIIVAFAGFSFASFIAVVVYLWIRMTDKIDEAVTKEQCEERKKVEDKEMSLISSKLCSHDHDENGKVRVTLNDK